MRILVTDQFAEIGGAQHGLLEAVEGFATRGWEVYAAVPAGPLGERLERFCANVREIRCGPFRSVHKSPVDAVRFAWQMREQAQAIRGAIESRGIDAVYANGPRVLPAAAWASSRTPVIFHSHSVVTQPAAARLAGFALRRGGVSVVASSRFVAQWLEPLIRPRQVNVIYNGIRGWNLPAPRPRGRFSRIGVLGRIAPEKGQLLFVRAARMASQRRPNLEFLIGGAPMFAGQDYLEEVRRESFARVHFTGWIGNPLRFFEQIDVLVVPSANVDANPRVIPEAFAAGVPVIAFDSGGVRELLEDGVTGRLVREHSAHALASAIVQSVDDPAATNAMARRGYECWKQRFTLERFQSELCGAIELAAFHRSEAPSTRASATA